MNKVFSIIGALLFVAAVVVGNFCNFPNATIIEIAVATFALASVIIGAVKKAKDEENFNWKTVVIIVLAVCSGILCCVAGMNDSIFAQIAAAVMALLAIILGMVKTK